MDIFTERFCYATKNFIEKSNEMERSLNRTVAIICKANEDATSRLLQSLNSQFLQLL